MITGEDDEESARSGWEELETFLGKSVGIEKATALGRVADRELLIQIIAVDGGEVEVGGRVIPVPVAWVGLEERVSDDRGKGEGEGRVSPRGRLELQMFTSQ